MAFPSDSLTAWRLGSKGRHTEKDVEAIMPFMITSELRPISAVVTGLSGSKGEAQRTQLLVEQCQHHTVMKVCGWEILVCNVWKTQSSILRLKMTYTGIILLSLDNVPSAYYGMWVAMITVRRRLRLSNLLPCRAEFTLWSWN